MLSILKDIRSGALPSNQFAGYLAYLLRKSFWLWFAIIALGAVIYFVN